MRYFLLIYALLFCFSCKEPYNPKIKETNENLLVVEGMINASGVSTIKLSRTVAANNGRSSNPEKQATLFIESESNETFPLYEQKPGVYNSVSLSLSSSKKYRLKIKTANNTNYASDFVPVKVSPAIEKVSWKAGEQGLDLYVSTSDSGDQSRYYRWEYTETWIFFVQHESFYIYKNGAFDHRAADEHIFQCWGNYNSSTIVLGSSAKLDHDVIHESPVLSIPSNDERLRLQYSILVKQTVLTKEAYAFWQNLKKNTESLGSIFDAQPSELQGNIRNVENPQEPVIGFICAGTSAEKRIFINRNELPSHYRFKPAPGCEALAEILPEDYDLYFKSQTFAIPIDYSPKGMYAASPECADCTLRGTNKKPAFWP